MSRTLAPAKLSPAAALDGSRSDETMLIGLTLIVPMYNEEACVAALTTALFAFEDKVSDRYDLEILLVDDGSTDDTVARIEAALGERRRYVVVRHSENCGIAAAIETGLRAATYSVAASIDSDGSYDLLELEPMIRELAQGVDMVTASPYHPLGGVDNVPPWRLHVSRLATWMYGLALGRRYSCYTSCFRVYRRAAVVDLPVTRPGFVGVAELMCRLLAAGGTVVEHPARLRSRVAGHSKMRVVRASRGHLRLMASLLAARLFPRTHLRD